MNAYNALTKLMRENPSLIFSNDGYENLPATVVEANKDAIDSVEEILKRCVKGFVSFQNFKPREDGSIAVRYQVYYNDERSFRGVAYTPLEDFKDFAITETPNPE